MKYCQATVCTTSEFADTLSVILMDLGSDGVTVTDYEDIKAILSGHTWDYVDDSLLKENDPNVYVSGYYNEDYDFSVLYEKLNELRAFKDLPVGTLELGLKKIDSADYENEWKKYYKPIELEKIVVVPEWLSCDSEKICVLLDPGMAFGTGSHETTKLCLGFLEKECVSGKKVADIGCGSGILGAAVLKLGAKHCFMSDIDEQAVKAAKHNCGLNGVSERAEIVLGSMPENCADEFDLVIANITADVLISLADSVYKSLCNGGKMIMSGIIHSRAQDVKNAYAERFELIEKACDGEWLGFVWQKR